MSKFSFECECASFHYAVSFFKTNHLKKYDSKIVFMLSKDSIHLKKTVFPKNKSSEDDAVVVMKTKIKGNILEFEDESAVIVFSVTLDQLKTLFWKNGKWKFSHDNDSTITAKTEDRHPTLHVTLSFHIEQAREELALQGFNTTPLQLTQFEFRNSTGGDDIFNVMVAKSSIFIGKRMKDFNLQTHSLIMRGQENEGGCQLAWEFELTNDTDEDICFPVLMQQLMYLNNIPDEKKQQKKNIDDRLFSMIIERKALVVSRDDYQVFIKAIQ
jgi:hypothetical protein